ncbi:cystatin-like [Dendropsophus ebraccatus]|uniref:cystatin-like n=1 Tax=Dendropsophus ebraccatus TaxID=150705 RepID=UPI003831439C
MMSAGLCSTALVALSLLSVYVHGAILAGGLQKQDPNDPEVVKAATFAVTGFNQRSNEEYDYKLMKIVSAESQVVAGVRYVLNVEIGRTDCKRTSTSEKASCGIIQDSELAKTLLCTFSVLEVPWENEETLQSSSCNTQQ